jgi:hypothetical protein
MDADQKRKASRGYLHLHQILKFTFPNPIDHEDNMNVSSFGVRNLNTLRNVCKTG